jgi:hypothetical protein
VPAKSVHVCSLFNAIAMCSTGLQGAQILDIRSALCHSCFRPRAVRILSGSVACLIPRAGGSFELVKTSRARSASFDAMTECAKASAFSLRDICREPRAQMPLILPGSTPKRSFHGRPGPRLGGETDENANTSSYRNRFHSSSGYATAETNVAQPSAPASGTLRSIMQGAGSLPEFDLSSRPSSSIFASRNRDRPSLASNAAARLRACGNRLTVRGHLLACGPAMFR